MPKLEFFDAWTSVGRTLGMHPRLPHSVDDLIGEMRRCHVANALVCRCGQDPQDLSAANRALGRSLPDFLSPLWTVIPGDAGDFPCGDQLLGDLENHRVPAVRILPKTHLWNPRGAAARKLFESLAEGGWPVFVPLDCEVSAAEFHELATALPNVRWVAVHGSWTRQREVADLVLLHPNVWMTLEKYHANRGLEHLIRQGAGDRLLFASGVPSASMGAAEAFVDWADADAATRAAVAGGNLRGLLKFQPAGKLSGFLEPDDIVADAMAGQPLSCEVIDFHSHILDDGANSGGNQVMLRGDADGLLDMADRIGINRIGVMTWVGIQGPDQDGGHVPVIAASRAAHGRFWGLATIHVGDQSDTRKIQDLEAVMAQGNILGLKPYPTLGLPYDHPQYAALWRFAEQHGLYVGIHPFHWYQPDEFISLCTRYPKLKVVAYHAGCTYEIADTIITLCRDFPNLYAEINYSSVTGGIIEYLVEGCGEDRVLFGTDQPMRDPRQQLGWVVYADLPVAIKKKILAENARSLLGELAASSGKVPAMI